MILKKGHNEELRVCYTNIILGNEIKADEAVGRVHISGRQQESMTILKAAHTVL
jgi:hypothetical protein